MSTLSAAKRARPAARPSFRSAFPDSSKRIAGSRALAEKTATIFLSRASSVDRFGGKHLRFVPRIQESRWLTENFLRPRYDGFERRPRRGSSAACAGQQARFRDRDRTAAAQPCDATIDNAFSDGEDYELLFAISPRERDRLQRHWKQEIPKTSAHAHRAPLSTRNPQHLSLCQVATFISNSAGRNRSVRPALCQKCQAGDVFALTGDSAAAKPNLSKVSPPAWAATAAVTSPTFTLIHEYSDGRMPVYHFDFFRIEDPQSAGRLGLDDYFFGDGVSVIEWADRFPELVPNHAHGFRLR